MFTNTLHLGLFSKFFENLIDWVSGLMNEKWDPGTRNGSLGGQRGQTGQCGSECGVSSFRELKIRSTKFTLSGSEVVLTIFFILLREFYLYRYANPHRDHTTVIKKRPLHQVSSATFTN